MILQTVLVTNTLSLLVPPTHSNAHTLTLHTSLNDRNTGSAAGHGVTLAAVRQCRWANGFVVAARYPTALDVGTRTWAGQ